METTAQPSAATNAELPASEGGASAASAPRTDWSSVPAILYIWIPACLLAFLLGAIPYGTGYGFERIPMTKMMSELWKMPDWEHCFLVPLAIAFIIYEMRDRLAVLRPEPTNWGLPILFVGLFFYWAGQRVDNQYIGYASMQILVAAWIILLLGWRFMITLAFPWLFLTFLWPLLFLETYLAFPLRLVMSEASVNALNFLGIESIKVGTAIISAPNALTNLPAGERFSVDVADPCSGIRSLFALMMVSALYGFFAFKQWWKHALIFLCSIPLAVAGNLVRILLLTIGTLLFGSEFAIGEGIENPSTFHMVAGFFVFAVALGGMLTIGWALNFEWGTLFHHLRQVVEKEPSAARPASGAKQVALVDSGKKEGKFTEEDPY
jgi:exosortase